VDVRTTSLADVQKDLGMQEGFDVGLEMSGNSSAFRDMLANMCHGSKIAMLGIPTAEMSIDWNTVIFNMLTIKGIYGREMYETWYKMTVMIESGLDISPIITHRFHYTEYEKAFEAMMSATPARSFSNGTGNRVMTLYDKLDQKLSERAKPGCSSPNASSYRRRGVKSASRAAPGAC